MRTGLKGAVCLLLTFGAWTGFFVMPAAASDARPEAGRRLTVIIDAGHGGADGGAVSPSGLMESAVNLDIARRIELILAFFGTDVVMTRTGQSLDYSDKATTIRAKKVEDQKRRLNLVNSTPNAVLISIHQNNFPDDRPFGAQVLYAPTEGSKAFAEYVQQLLITVINPKNRRTAVKIPESIMLLNHIKCPAILVECGFLSNPEEERLLQTGSYKLKLASVIAAGYLKHQRELYSGGMNEG